MSAKATKDKDSILADAKNFIKVLLPAIQKLPKIERHEGAAIGRLIWQTAMGLYINDEIKWLNEVCNVRTVCFVDDIVIQVPDNKKSYVLSLIPELRKRLATKNISLNEKKFYCQ